MKNFNNLENLRYFHIEFYYNDKVFEEFEKINLPRLRFISLKDQDYSLEALEKKV